MQNFSVTQTTNYVAFAGVLVILLGKFGLEISNEDATIFIGAVVSIIGIVSNFINRYKEGDVTVAGTRK